MLSVDPGANYGAALFYKGKLRQLWYGGHTLQECSGVLKDAIQYAAENGGGKLVVVVEDQYLPKRGSEKDNFRGLKTLLKRRHTWEILSEIRGKEYTTVWPASWQVLLKEADCGTGATTKDKSMALCEDLWPTQVHFRTSHDLCDAALIGLHYCRLQIEEYGEWQMAG